MSSSVDNIIYPRHDVDVTLLIDDSSIACGIVAGIIGQVFLDEGRIIAPERHRMA